MRRAIFLAVVLACAPGARATSTNDACAAPKHVRILTVGNSFAVNATRFLPELVAAAGDRLTLQGANLGGCSLERHWRHVLAHTADSNAVAGTPYKLARRPCSLNELLRQQPWDVVTLQQFSMLSRDVNSYRPYASNLWAYIRHRAPQARIWWHQTWAYRADDRLFNKDYTWQDMHAQVRAAYHTIARELGCPIIPVGAAFHAALTRPDWQYAYPDPAFNYRAPTYPHVPAQPHSLHHGWFWPSTNTFSMDGHHANTAGCYLGAAVWYETLFGKSVVGNRFVPAGMTTQDVAVLQQVAHEVCRARAAVLECGSRASALSR
jgi:hypothetical protein